MGLSWLHTSQNYPGQETAWIRPIVTRLPVMVAKKKYGHVSSSPQDGRSISSPPTLLALTATVRHETGECGLRSDDTGVARAEPSMLQCYQEPSRRKSCRNATKPLSVISQREATRPWSPESPAKNSPGKSSVTLLSFLPRPPQILNKAAKSWHFFTPTNFVCKTWTQKIEPKDPFTTCWTTEWQRPKTRESH